MDGRVSRNASFSSARRALRRALRRRHLPLTASHAAVSLRIQNRLSRVKSHLSQIAALLLRVPVRAPVSNACSIACCAKSTIPYATFRCSRCSGSGRLLGVGFAHLAHPCTPLRPRVCKGSTGSDWAESAIALCFSPIGGGRLRSRAACTPCTRLGPNSSWRRTCGSAADTLSAGSCVVCVGGLSTYTTFLYISRGKGCARCARPGSTFADRPETQRNRSLRRFGADHSFAHPSGQGCARVCKGVQMGAALTVGGEPASCSGHGSKACRQ